MWPHGSLLWTYLGSILDLVDPIGPYLGPILGYYLGPGGPHLGPFGPYWASSSIDFILARFWPYVVLCKGCVVVVQGCGMSCVRGCVRG
jgi:hypothetical protein